MGIFEIRKNSKRMIWGWSSGCLADLLDGSVGIRAFLWAFREPVKLFSLNILYYATIHI